MSLTSQWSTMPPGQAAVSYASLILERVSQGMLDNQWSVDWANAPATSGFYPEAELRTLPLPRLGSDNQEGIGATSIQSITDGLYLAYAPTALRLSVNLNDRVEVHQQVMSAKWGRATASGGGRYCVDVYLVQGGGGDLPAGIHHFSPVHNGWEQIDPHDRTEQVRKIQGYPLRAHRYLCYTINYWQSGFKYNDFAYQATAMDMGTIVGSLHALWGEGTVGSWDMDVNEPAVTELLGLDPRDDGLYAIQGWAHPDGKEPIAAPGPVVRGRHGSSADRGAHRPQRFPTTVALQRDMALEQVQHDHPTKIVEDLISSDELTKRATEALTRETSFGRFTGDPIDVTALLRVLAGGTRATTALPEASWEYLVYASAVTGLASGLYRCHPQSLSLVPLQMADQEDFLASTYFLKNYDGRRAAATVIVSASLFEASRQAGIHGYRFINAVVGACCQGLSTEAAVAGLGSGTALGFDARAHADHAGLDPDHMCPMLMIMIGVDDPRGGQVTMQVIGGHP